MKWYVLVAVMSMLVLWPLFRSGFYISDDGEWMIIRLSAFYQSLAEGQFPVRFLGRLNYSYGYPVANFLYPGFLYIGSIIHFIGFSFVNSIKIILGASVLGATLFLFASLKRNFSALASFIGTFSFVTAPYLAFDLYKRGSVGEVLAIFAATLVIWSIEASSKVILPLAIGLLIVAHNSLALMFIVFFIVYLTVLKRLSWIIYLLLGLGLAAFFWIPAIFERNLVRFSLVTVSAPREYFVSLDNFDLVGLLFLASLVIYLFTRRCVSDGHSIYTLGFLIGLYLASPWSAALWESPTFASVFQFPYRFLAITLVCGPWLIANIVDNLVSVRGKLVVLFFILAVISLLPYLNSISFVDRPEGYYTTNEGTTTVANEYMPRWAGGLPAERNSNRIEIFEGRGIIEPRTVSTQQIEVDLDLEEDSILTINSIYYPGWGVVLDGHPVTIDYQNDRGLMRVDVPKGTHRLVAEFRETPLRFAADSISLVSAIVWILIVSSSLIGKRKR